MVRPRIVSSIPWSPKIHFQCQRQYRPSVRIRISFRHTDPTYVFEVRWFGRYPIPDIICKSVDRGGSAVVGVDEVNKGKVHTHAQPHPHPPSPASTTIDWRTWSPVGSAKKSTVFPLASFSMLEYLNDRIMVGAWSSINWISHGKVSCSGLSCSPVLLFDRTGPDRAQGNRTALSGWYFLTCTMFRC